MNTYQKKLILVKEYAPLWAMRKVFGPTRGPLTKPTPTPIAIIGELLQQTGKDKVTIQEVVELPLKGTDRSRIRYSEPVTLTLENYMMPYEDIVAGKQPPAPVEVTKMDPVKVNKSVEPVIVEPEPVEVPEKPEPAPVVIDVAETPTVAEAASVVEVTPPAEAPVVVEEPVPEPVQTEKHAEDVAVPEPEVVPEAEVAETLAAEPDDPYAGMSKKERRRAMREAAAKAAVAEAVDSIANNNE